MKNFTKDFYQRELRKSDVANFWAVFLCGLLLIVIYFGITSFFVVVNDMRAIPKTCSSFTNYADLQAWIAKHPEDFNRLDAWGTGRNPGIPCDNLYYRDH